MRAKSQAIIEKLKKSRAQPKIGRDHFEALADDLNELGKEEFLAAIESGFAPRKATSSVARKSAKAKPKQGSVPEVAAGPHPLEGLFMVALRRTGLKRPEFADRLIETANELGGVSLNPPKSKRSVTKLLPLLEDALGGDKKLTEAIRTTGERYRLNR